MDPDAAAEVGIVNLSCEFWMTVRHALLILLGGIEKALKDEGALELTTKECRQIAKRTERSAGDG